MKKILINAASAGEIRVAITEDDKIFNLSVESISSSQKRANIYKGVVTRVEPSLEAAFVEYGESKQGFLPFKDIALAALTNDADEDASVADIIKPNHEIIVQVEKEERGNKGASLTTYISIAGQYLILLPFASSDRSNGISRSLSNDQRNEARDLLKSIDVPEDYRIILRTASLGRQPNELQWNLNYLTKIWELITEAAEKTSQPSLLYKESDVVMKTIRDNFSDDIEALIVDDPNIHKGIRDFVSRIMPDKIELIQLFQEQGSLFSHFQIEKQIESVYSRSVNLKSGGEIVIDLTEALVSIDVNSGRSTRGKDIEETALLTNLEAAEEIMRQLRLRDLGGLVVIDFIDMLSSHNRRQVEQKIAEFTLFDRARINLGKISRFGLLELSRQHLGNSLTNLTRTQCASCGGIYTIRTINSLCLSLVSLLDEEASSKGVSTIQLELPLDSATFLLNEHREDVHRIETRHGINIIVVPNHKMAHPNYKLKALGIDATGKLVASHKLRSKIKKPKPLMESKAPKKTKAILQNIFPETNAPQQSFWSRLFSKSKPATPTSAKKQTTTVDASHDHSQRRSNRRSHPRRKNYHQRSQ